MDIVVGQEQTTPESQAALHSRPLSITGEMIVYAALIMLSIVLRIAELDTVPLSEAESQRAAAAWQAITPAAAGEADTADSPLLFVLQGFSFAMSGANEASSRSLTALAGVLLAVAPLLFRPLLGSWRTFVIVLLLTCSPTLLIASRSSSPVVWALLAGVIGLWGVWRFYETRNQPFAYTAVGMFTVLVLLTDTAGFMLALALLLAGVFALALTQLSASEFDDDSPQGPEAQPAIWPGVRAVLREVNWSIALALAGAAVLLVSTGFLLYRPGLSNVSTLLTTGLSGLSQTASNLPVFYPLVVSFFYEIFVWVFAIIAVIWFLRRAALSFTERFLLGWLLFALLAIILYPGGRADHALWLLPPLAGLSAYLIVELLSRVERILNYPAPVPVDEYNTEDQAASLWQTPPWWARWLLALIVCALLMLYAVHIQTFSRAFLQVNGATINEDINLVLARLSSPQSQLAESSLVWVLILPPFVIVGIFLTSSIWGALTSLQGLALGTLAFTLITGVGAGWNAAVFRAADAAEFWHLRATGREVFLLEDTLFELSQRETGGWHTLPIVVVVDNANITADGPLAWLLRDYTNVRYVPNASEARGAPIIILPLPNPDVEPELGGDYVGALYILSRGWNLNSLQGMDWLPWWLQRRVNAQPFPRQQIALYLRQDIYDGTP